MQENKYVNLDKFQVKLVVIVIVVMTKLSFVMFLDLLFGILPHSIKQLIEFDEWRAHAKGAFIEIFSAVKFRHGAGVTLIGVGLIIATVLVAAALYIGANKIIVKFLKYVMINKIGLEKTEMDKELIREKPKLKEPIKILFRNLLITFKELTKCNWFHYLMLGLVYKRMTQNIAGNNGVFYTIILVVLFCILRTYIWHVKEMKSKQNKINANGL